MLSTSTMPLADAAQRLAGLIPKKASSDSKLKWNHFKSFAKTAPADLLSVELYS